MKETAQQIKSKYNYLKLTAITGAIVTIALFYRFRTASKENYSTGEGKIEVEKGASVVMGKDNFTNTGGGTINMGNVVYNNITQNTTTTTNSNNTYKSVSNPNRTAATDRGGVRFQSTGNNNNLEQNTRNKIEVEIQSILTQQGLQNIRSKHSAMITPYVDYQESYISSGMVNLPSVRLDLALSLKKEDGSEFTSAIIELEGEGTTKDKALDKALERLKEQQSVWNPFFQDVRKEMGI